MCKRVSVREEGDCVKDRKCVKERKCVMEAQCVGSRLSVWRRGSVFWSSSVCVWGSPRRRDSVLGGVTVCGKERTFLEEG